MDVTMFKDLMDPQVFVLAIVLYIVGIGIKRTSLIKNKFIPVILGTIGVIFISLYIFSTNALSSFQEICAAIFAAFTQGVLCAAVAVYANQIFKQLIKIEGITEEEADIINVMDATLPISEEDKEEIKKSRRRNKKDNDKETEEDNNEVNKTETIENDNESNDRFYDEDEN
jgi:hypothetical protein